MLYLLTGDIQTGKTRLLERELDCARERGVFVCGVLAPGVWVPGSHGGLEKTGIDNLLLPQGEIVRLACRRDPAHAAADIAPGEDAVAARAGLGWVMSASALARVNAHFDRLAREEAPIARERGVLVVDELGKLELSHGGGLTSALDLLRQGPRPAWGDAVAVVRPALVGAARDALAGAWGRVRVADLRRPGTFSES